MDTTGIPFKKNYILPDSKLEICCAIKGVISNIRAAFPDICEEKLFELKVILSELLVNALKHGNKMDEYKALELEMMVNGDRKVMITIQDQGEGFNYRALYNEAAGDMLSGNPCLEEHGRGLVIVRKLCDRVTYNDKGNKVEAVLDCGNIGRCAETQG